MSALTASTKRPLESTTSTDNDTDDKNAIPKKNNASKSSRTELDQEAKLKRTAQNRAAQRAFRERKERKMKELEAKVDHLSNIQKQNEIESEFLRSQLITLVKELKKYRPETANDSQVLNYLAKHENGNFNENLSKKSNFSFAFPWDDNNATTDKSDNLNTTTNNNIPSPDNSPVTASNDKKNYPSSVSSIEPLNQNNNNNISSLSPSLDDNDGISPSINWLDNMLHTEDLFNEQLSSFSNTPISRNDSNESKNPMTDSQLISNEFNFEDQFDEKVTDFCIKMNQVCGTRSNPIPKKSTSNLPSTESTPLFTNTFDSPSFGQLNIQNIESTNSDNTNNDTTPDDNGIFSFLNPSLAFPSSTSPENSLSDGSINNNIDNNNNSSLNNFRDTSIFDDFLKHEAEPSVEDLINEEIDDINDVVPSKDKNLLRCSEVWDRITAHPKYSDIDIDGLCGELMAKAKCSEKGVVVNAEDVQSALSKHLS
ncbi:hypothetical protein KAFR_0C05400 [Kazachstania africana CBS 2517]|uniref:BZIP domain-containing protein n=1 Tax=Kazachstania africana (strain ATCC 22294 / BCRC 22015 / CBS 2517 / CECT 1963 / NBRC 1671 / NRRL Y-8276) TaxID=1071382 RepID=H2AT31_KAZAF|nr:hypothetical protein KAFR_0C05400 [Kazachstania africana CBS 2517]CCF57531.1 hypothetical protein KAFR_0C05400 [Kazachstania africana CBS 2517]